MKRIGFVGLGNMGASMARNLLNSSAVQKEHVMLFDMSRQAMEATKGDNIKGLLAESIPQLATECNYIITMLPATDHVNQVLTDAKNGIFLHAKPGTLIIDSSTIDPLASKALHEQANEKSLRMLDAPVSGGVTGAAAGTLTFMVGGKEETIEDAKELFNAMGKSIVHCGDAGAGGVTKLCNNLALAISMIGTSEAMALGLKLGMDSKRLASVLNTSTARCWSSDTYNPVPGVIEGIPSSNNYVGGFGSALMSKDLKLALKAGEMVDQNLPLGEKAGDIYSMLSGDNSPYAQNDFSVVYQYLLGPKSK